MMVDTMTPRTQRADALERWAEPARVPAKSVGSSVLDMRAGTLDVVTRRVGRTLLVLDATATAISSYREAGGRAADEIWDFSYERIS